MVNGPNGLPMFIVTVARSPRLREGKTSFSPANPTGRIGAAVRVIRNAVPGRAGRRTDAQLPPSGKIPITPPCLRIDSAALSAKREPATGRQSRAPPVHLVGDDRRVLEPQVPLLFDEIAAFALADVKGENAVEGVRPGRRAEVTLRHPRP